MFKHNDLKYWLNIMAKPNDLKIMAIHNGKT